MFFKGFVFLLGFVLSALPCAGQDPALLAGTARQAEEFQQKAPLAVTREMLRQRSFRRPVQPAFAIGIHAVPQPPRYITEEIVSDYTVGHLKGAPATDLVEFRELISRNGAPIQTPEAARRAITEDIRSGEDRVRKHMLAEFTRLGLVDVATDYGLILLAFTTRGQQELKISPAGDGFVGAEEAFQFEWAQTSGGALEFRGRKVARRLMTGSIWLRKSDGMPLRVSATFEHQEPNHLLRDDATVEYAATRLGFPAPVTVAHRHYVDGVVLTENLYTYEPFRFLTSDSTIRYTGTPDPPPAK
jgi:hypothetical protein